MRILLIGEYSRLHNSLKEGLQKLGHEVTLIGTNDGFKNLPVDYNYSATFFTKSWIRPVVKVIAKLTTINLIKVEHAYRFNKFVPILKGYDIVQLINENSIKTHPFLEIKLLKKIFSSNTNVFLMSCGADHISVKYAFDGHFRYSILTPLKENNSLKKNYQFILRYLNKPYIKLHKFVYQNVRGVIASDLDYHIPLEGHSKYLGMIPNPINIDSIPFFTKENTNPIVIFHGVNASNYIKKGNRFFDEALRIVKDKFGDKVEIISTSNLAYNYFLDTLNRCHIYLDQVYAYDQGFAALEAMAKGIVVFTGAEKEWLNYYNLDEDKVAINALPNSQNVADKLEMLIVNPELLKSISTNACNFIEKEHHYVKIAQMYLDTWNAQS